MYGKYARCFVMAALLLILAANVCSAERLLDQASTLGGKVSSQRLAMPGDKVKEGQILLQVEGIAGPTPAVRAAADGVVERVLVRAGDTIASRQVVIRLKVAD